MNFKKYKGVIIGIIAVVILFKLWTWDIRKGRNDNTIVKENVLTEIRATLSNKPTIEVAEQGGPWVPIKLNEFPEFGFDIGGIKYSALNAREFVNELSIGDSVFLAILTYDYETKIRKKKSLRPSETIIGYGFIKPYSIKSEHKVYMTLTGVNFAWQDNHDSGTWFLYGALIISTLLGIIYFVLYLTGFNKKFLKWLNDIQASH